MITGEERVVPNGTTHIARTIETVDLGRVVDLCVIDEVQMLGDHSRGWAWTQAILGTPARRVVLTGAPEAIPMVEHLLAMTGEPLKVRILKREGGAAGSRTKRRTSRSWWPEMPLLHSPGPRFTICGPGWCGSGGAWRPCTALSGPKSGGRKRPVSAIARPKSWSPPTRSGWA